MSSVIPVIGVSGSIDKAESQSFVLRSYMQALIHAGAAPVLISPDVEGEALEACLDRLDGVLLAGGNDVDPAVYGQWPVHELGEVNPVRDAFEMRLIRSAVQRNMPVLGICRGIQMMNAALGGSLWQDLPSQYRTQQGERPMQHSQTAPVYHLTHDVYIEEGTRLAAIMGGKLIRANSFHHQAVREPAPGLRVSAHAADGVVEAVEHESLAYFIGVQWHPERYDQLDEAASALFASFTQAAVQYAGR